MLTRLDACISDGEKTRWTKHKLFKWTLFFLAGAAFSCWSTPSKRRRRQPQLMRTRRLVSGAINA